MNNIIIFMIMDNNLEGLLKIRRLRTSDIWLDIISSKRFDRTIFDDMRKHYKEIPKSTLYISVSRLVNCPYYSILYADEYGSHYQLRGELFQDKMISILAENYNVKIKSKEAKLFSLIELDTPLKGYTHAMVYGFADAIGEYRGNDVIIEAKSSIERPRVASRIAQLATYMRLYQRMYKKRPEGFLVAYIEDWEPPIAIWHVTISSDAIQSRIKERVMAYINHAKSPVDKSVCGICPIRDRCEFRTGNPYRDEMQASWLY